MSDINKFLDDNVGLVGDERVSIENYLVVSNEGFFQSIGDIWRNMRHGRPPKLTNQKGDPALNKPLLEKTYLNPDWLAKRRFVEGEVRIAKFGKGFTGDYNGDMRKLADAWLAAYKKNQAMAEPFYQRVKPTFEFVNAYHYRDPEKLKAFIEARDLSYTAPKFAVVPAALDVSQEGASLPALTKEQCEKLVQTIVYMCSAFFHNLGFHKKWEEAYGMTLNNRWYLYSNDGAKVLSQATYSDADHRVLAFKLINEVYEFTSRFESDYYKRKCIGFDAFYNWLRGAIAYIDASVK
jgi:hypothetical protein